MNQEDPQSSKTRRTLDYRAKLILIAEAYLSQQNPETIHQTAREFISHGYMPQSEEEVLKAGLKDLDWFKDECVLDFKEDQVMYLVPAYRLVENRLDAANPEAKARILEIIKEAGYD